MGGGRKKQGGKETKRERKWERERKSEKERKREREREKETIWERENERNLKEYQEASFSAQESVWRDFPSWRVNRDSLQENVDI